MKKLASFEKIKEDQESKKIEIPKNYEAYIKKEEYIPLLKKAVAAAESILFIWEEKFPKDKRPREAIDITNLYIEYQLKADNADKNHKQEAENAVLEIRKEKAIAAVNASDAAHTVNINQAARWAAASATAVAMYDVIDAVKFAEKAKELYKKEKKEESVLKEEDHLGFKVGDKIEYQGKLGVIKKLGFSDEETLVKFDNGKEKEVDIKKIAFKESKLKEDFMSDVKAFIKDNAGKYDKVQQLIPALADKFGIAIDVAKKLYVDLYDKKVNENIKLTEQPESYYKELMSDASSKESAVKKLISIGLSKEEAEDKVDKFLNESKEPSKFYTLKEAVRIGNKVFRKGEKIKIREDADNDFYDDMDKAFIESENKTFPSSEVIQILIKKYQGKLFNGEKLTKDRIAELVNEYDNMPV
jgi:hypothetical protein